MNIFKDKPATEGDAQQLPRELWRHPHPETEELEAFRRYVNEIRGKNLQTFADIHKYSVTELSNFWEDVWNTVGMIYEGEYTSVVDENARIDSLPKWFPGVKLNFVENVLFTRGHMSTDHCIKIGKEDNKVALTFLREGGTEGYDMTWGELRTRVGLYSQAMRAHGVKKGDRIAGVVSNSAEALVVMMAAISVGAIHSSTATDMGTKGVLDRMRQIEPTFIFMDDTAVWMGKQHDLRPRMMEIVEGMKDVKGFRGMVALPRFADKSADISGVPKCQTLKEFLSKAPSKELVFERVPFHHPHIVAYSSGTTGLPKCIVHAGGAACLTFKKDAKLHTRSNSNHKYLQYTTTGWIMYMAQINSLMIGWHVVVYDGSPFFPNHLAFIKLIGDRKITFLGSSPRYFQELKNRNLHPRNLTDLSHLEIVSSAGMVLSKELSEWFYDCAFPSHVQLVNFIGGTDTNCSIGLGNAMSAVHPAEIQGLSCGMAVEIFELADDGLTRIKGKRVPDGTPGELVITKPFPTIPVMFWGKDGAKLYYNSYFAKYDNVWTQGDFAQINPKTGGLLCLGRADGVLNPSGVRFGSSDLYSVLENRFADRIADSVVVGQRRPQDTDETVVMFLLLRPGAKFTKQLVTEVKSAIAKDLSKRHVPKYIFETKDIPQTTNMKKVETPVRKILSGKKVVPSATLRNPESLAFYYRFVDVEKRWKIQQWQWGRSSL